MSTEVGSLNASLTLDMSDFQAGMTQARELAAELASALQQAFNPGISRLFPLFIPPIMIMQKPFQLFLFLIHYMVQNPLIYPPVLCQIPFILVEMFMYYHS